MEKSITKKINTQTAARSAKALTSMCIRNNTSLEDLHAGYYPISKTGDYTDVKVVDAEGKEILWSELSRFDDVEMKKLMKEIVNNIFTYYTFIQQPNFEKLVNYFTYSTQENWDAPELNMEWDEVIKSLTLGNK